MLRHVIPPARFFSPAPVPRVARMRECESERHIQPLLFRPVGDEAMCPACTAAARGSLVQDSLVAERNERR